jgi:hypothetical protein
MRSLGYGVVVASVFAASAAFGDRVEARPPRNAAIRDHVGMAGVRVGTTVALDRRLDPQRVTSGPMSAWGPVEFGFCFEGTACIWRVPGGGEVGATVRQSDNRLLELSTTSRHWKTARGVRVGQPMRRAQSRYGGRLHRQRTCEMGGFGAELDVLVIRRRRRSTVFEVRRNRIAAIWVLAYRLPRREC